MQYDVSNFGEKRMMDVAEMVRYGLWSCFLSCYNFHEKKHGRVIVILGQDLPLCCRYFEDRMGWTITNIWNLLTYDVEDTVYTVCKQVLDEEDIPKDMRTTRAAAIKEIGVIFQVLYI